MYRVPDDPSERRTVTAEEIVATVKRTEFDAVCDATSGDCVAVAAAIARVFDVDAFAWAAETEFDAQPAHLAVVVDDRVIDATGEIGWEGMQSYAFSGLRGAELDKAVVDTVPLDMRLPADGELVDELTALLVDACES